MAVNAQAVVNVQVNAAAFNAFMTQFGKWQSNLVKVPGQIAQINAQLGALVKTHMQGNALLTQQMGLMTKIAGAHKTVAVHTESASHRWKEMVKHGKDFAGWVAGAHAHLMKWGGIIGGIITGMGGASAWGLMGLAQWVRGGQISASKVNMRQGELRALEGTFGKPYGINVEGMANTVETAKGNPASPENIALQLIGAGHAKNAQGTEKVAIVLDQLRAKMKGGMSPEYISMLTNGVFGDTGQLRALKNISDDEYNKGRAGLKHEAKELDLSDEKVKRWNTFLTEIDKAVEQLKVILADNLTPVLEMFTKNSKKWLEQLRHFMESKEFQDFLESIPHKVARFGELMGAIVDAMEWGLKKLGLLKPTAEERKKLAVQGALTWDEMTPEERQARTEAVDKAKQEFKDAITDALRDVTGFNAQPRPQKATPRVIPNPDGSYQDGTPMVPKTGTYTLHRGEMVLPEADADLLRHSTIEDWKRSISGIESGGNYSILGKLLASGDQAVGKYQVMKSNIAAWTRQALGFSMSPEQFRANPNAQERVFETIFGGYVRQFGNPIDAAAAWFSGQPLGGAAAGAKDALGTTIPGYIRQFLAGLGSRSGGGAVTINDNTGGNVALSMSGMTLQGPLPLYPV